MGVIAGQDVLVEQRSVLEDSECDGPFLSQVKRASHSAFFVLHFYASFCFDTLMEAGCVFGILLFTFKYQDFCDVGFNFCKFMISYMTTFCMLIFKHLIVCT